MITYQTIKSKEHYFHQVVELGNENSKTLGLFPEGALKEYAEKGQIICAIGNDTVKGYLLYAITQRKSRIRLVHLCIKEENRSSGIATGLLNQLKNKYSKTLRGIALSCREDYKEASEFWKKYGFKPVDRVRSRSRKERYLKKWWYDFGNHDLFTIANSNSPKSKVLLDTSIIIKLRDVDMNDASGTKYLLADWIVDEVDYYYAAEIYNEIDRDTDNDRAKFTRNYLRKFKKIPTKNEDVKKVYDELLEIVKGVSPNDLSDKKQLAECIAGGLDYFITTDTNILNHEEVIYEKYSISVLSPAEFILMIDKIVNNFNYNSIRLAGANYEYKNPSSKDINLIIEQFIYLSQGEKKNELRNTITKYVAARESTRVKIVEQKDSLLGIWLANITEEQIQVKLLRTKGDKLSNPLFNQLVNNIISFAINEGKRFVIIQEKFISDHNKGVLEHFGFNFVNNSWQKLILNNIIDTSAILTLAKDTVELQYLKKIQDRLGQIQENEIACLIERKLWPLKFINLKIPVYIVPIKPYWASQLFDHFSAQASMFGSAPQLVWNRENIYYRSVNPVSEKYPARILWYVSSSKNNRHRAKSIVATSYLDDVIIKEAKQLFKEYKSFGIYQWKDIFALAKQDIHQPIKALKFSDTEVFRKPIKLQKVNDILISCGRKSNTFASPLEVTNNEFIKIYKEGLNG